MCSKIKYTPRSNSGRVLFTGYRGKKHMKSEEAITLPFQEISERGLA
jgi:hypothetical protein